ncbi:MAG: NAD(P)H-dependent oxidoreductase subunit E [Xanthomonadales bacterium]
MQRTELLDFLWRAQNAHGHIRTADVEEAAAALGVSTIDIEGVISFYHFFHRRPKGAFTVYLNNSPVAASKGFERMRDAFERYTGGRFGSVDPSGRWGLFETACIGLSDMEPAALINFQPFTHLNSMKIRDIVGQLRQGAEPAEICDPVPDHIRSVPDGDRAILLRDYDPGVAVGRLPALKPEAVLAEIRKSGLRGMGGAFFPAGIKWASCRKAAGTPKYIVCNADEGEPGTFKDRVLMNALPGLVLEGMVVAAYAVGAEHGIIYLRAEYTWLRAKLQQTIDHFRKMNLLGRNIGGVPDFNFDIRLQLGAGAYVCGEETALLNSLEGLRGEPRNKRVYPTERGFLQKPTVVNNVETFCAAARIIQLGADRFLAVGTPASPGTKLLSVSGDCRLPGIYEVEWGITLRRVLELCAADRPRFIQVSGPSGECVSLDEADRRIALDDLPCGGSVMIFNRQRDILEILANYNRFFKQESCGLCTPCRGGNFILQKKLELFSNRLAHTTDVADVRAWGNIMKTTCRCGLGKTAPNALLGAIDKFPEVFGGQSAANPERLSRGFDLDEAVRTYDRFGS